MKLLRSTIFIIFLAHSSWAQTLSYPVTEQTCVSPNGVNGTCVNIKECQPMINILKRAKPLEQSDLEFIRTSHCGFEGKFPKVCCVLGVDTVLPILTAPATLSQNVNVDANASATPSPPDVTRHPNLRLLNHNICGPITEQKIFNGNKTGVFDFPWMTLIAYQTATGPEFRCGGSIINKRYVLTAAHCLTGLPSGLTLAGVRVGEHDISKERDCDEDEEALQLVCAERYQDFGIESAHHHPQYSLSSLQNDIGLIRLNGDIDFRPASVRPICLPIGSAATIGQKRVTVTGWGATEHGPRSLDLLKVFISPMPNDQCAKIYKMHTKITYKQMCAGGENKDSCLGDSGGPLQSPAIYNNNVKYIQYGIVSFGMKTCGTAGYPGVYTRLTYFLDWVLNTMRD